MAHDEAPPPAATQQKTKDPEDGVLRIYPPRGGAYEDPLREATRAYAAGDFRAVRRLARQAMAGEPSPAEIEFATQLLDRTANDAVALWVGLASFALFWLTIYLTLWR